MDADNKVQELEIVPEQEQQTKAASKRRKSRKKTVVTQPSKQVEAMLAMQLKDNKEHFGVGDELPTYLM